MIAGTVYVMGILVTLSLWSFTLQGLRPRETAAVTVERCLFFWPVYLQPPSIP